MPGITGIVSIAGPLSLERLEAALFPAPLLPRHRMEGGGIACVVVGGSGSSGIVVRDGIRLAFEGYLFDDGAPRGPALLGWLLERFKERGDAFVVGLNGAFQMVVHARDTTRLYVDHVASRRLFYRLGDGWLAFSPEVAPLAGLGHAALDGANLVNFLANGRFFAGRSLLEPVRQLLPGEHLVWSGGELALGRWYRHRLVPAEPFDEASAMERLQEAVRRAVVSRWEQADRPAILLTGGWDSRYILHTIAEHVADTSALRTVTWGERPELPGGDIQVAGEIARRFGTRHLVLERRVDRVPACFGEMFEAQSGMTEHALMHADELAICRELAEAHGIRALFRGDECFGPTGGGVTAIREALGQVSLSRAAELEGGGAAWLEAQSDHVARLVAGCPPAPNDVRDTLYCEERLPASLHHLSYYKLHYQEVFNPLLDLEVLRLAATFPVSHRLDKALFKACYRQRFARHLDIPFAERSNGVEWSEALRRSPGVAALLRAGLETLPAPLDRAFFLARLAEALGEDARPSSAPRVAPAQLAIRAFVLGRWLRRWASA